MRRDNFFNCFDRNVYVFVGGLSFNYGYEGGDLGLSSFKSGFCWFCDGVAGVVDQCMI